MADDRDHGERSAPVEFPPEGLSLSDAIEKLSIPAAWQALKRVEASLDDVASIRYPSWVEPGGGRFLELNMERDRRLGELNEERRIALARQIESLKANLMAGTFVATGFSLPVGPDSQPVRIPSEHWRFLDMSLANSVAFGPGIEFNGVRIHCPEDIQSNSKASPASGHLAADAAALEDRRKPGRPTRMPEIKAELRRRFESGGVYDSLAAESRHLGKWAREEFGDQAPSAEHIRKQTRELYNKLRETKKKAKME